MLVVSTLVLLVATDTTHNAAGVPVLKQEVARMQKEIDALRTVPADLARIETKLDLLLTQVEKKQR